jgi:metal-dependent amidase/aminoacylase/carboxypeptidase family protein
MLMPTNLLIGQYTMLAIAAYTLFGLGLAFYATPSTDAALPNLPDDQAGSGSGICTSEIREGVPGAVLVNDPVQTLKAANIARQAFGADAVMYPGPSYLGSEDFAFMLQKKPGTHCLLGNGHTPMVHHPQYIFDDDILPMGAAYWVTLTEQYLH